MMEVFFASLALGLLAGLSAGLFGIGGGALIVPILSWLLAAQAFKPEHVMLVAVATSLATALFTSAASVRAHHKLGNIDWHRAFRLGPSLLLGAAAGAIVAEDLSADSLRWFFITYLLYTSVRMALPKKKHAAAAHKPRLYLDFPMGLLIGVLSAILGIGGGTMSVPYLAGAGLAMKNAVATSSTCALPITLSAAASYMALGWHDHDLPAGSLGYIYLPAFAGIVMTSMVTAPLGAKLAHRLPAHQLKRYFAIVLLLIAIKMAW